MRVVARCKQEGVDCKTLLEQHGCLVDNVLESSSQSSSFQAAAAPLLDTCAHGQRGLLIVYGNSGSGKTHGSGLTADQLQLPVEEHSGIVSRSIDYIFGRLMGHATPLNISCLEVVGNKINDLIPYNMSESKLDVSQTETGVFHEVATSSAEEAILLVKEACSNRTTAGSPPQEHAVHLGHAVVTMSWKPSSGTSASMAIVDCCSPAAAHLFGHDLAAVSSHRKTMLTLGKMLIALRGGRTSPAVMDCELTRALQPYTCHTTMLCCLHGDVAGLQSSTPSDDEPTFQLIRQMGTFPSTHPPTHARSALGSQMGLEERPVGASPGSEGRRSVERIGVRNAVNSRGFRETMSPALSSHKDPPCMSQDISFLSTAESPASAGPVQHSPKPSAVPVLKLSKCMHDAPGGPRAGGSPRATPGRSAIATPGGSARATPGGCARATPGGIARAAPGGSARATPGGSARATPEGKARASSDGSATATPSGNVRIAPGGHARATPEGTGRAGHHGHARATPSGNARIRPGSSARATPDGSAKAAHGGHAKTTPEGAVKTTPGGNSGARTAPGPSATPGGGMSATAQSHRPIRPGAAPVVDCMEPIQCRSPQIIRRRVHSSTCTRSKECSASDTSFIPSSSMQRLHDPSGQLEPDKSVSPVAVGASSQKYTVSNGSLTKPSPRAVKGKDGTGGMLASSGTRSVSHSLQQGLASAKAGRATSETSRSASLKGTVSSTTRHAGPSPSATMAKARIRNEGTGLSGIPHQRSGVSQIPERKRSVSPELMAPKNGWARRRSSAVLHEVPDSPPGTSPPHETPARSNSYGGCWTDGREQSIQNGKLERRCVSVMSGLYRKNSMEKQYKRLLTEFQYFLTNFEVNHRDRRLSQGKGSFKCVDGSGVQGPVLLQNRLSLDAAPAAAMMATPPARYRRSCHVSDLCHQHLPRTLRESPVIDAGPQVPQKSVSAASPQSSASAFRQCTPPVAPRSVPGRAQVLAKPLIENPPMASHAVAEQAVPSASLMNASNAVARCPSLQQRSSSSPSTVTPSPGPTTAPFLNTSAQVTPLATAEVLPPNPGASPPVNSVDPEHPSRSAANPALWPHTHGTLSGAHKSPNSAGRRSTGTAKADQATASATVSRVAAVQKSSGASVQLSPQAVITSGIFQGSMTLQEQLRRMELQARKRQKKLKTQSSDRQRTAAKNCQAVA